MTAFSPQSHQDDAQHVAEPCRMVEELMHRVANKGIRIWKQHGNLRYSAPQGAMTDADLQNLRDWKQAIVAYLEAKPAATVRGYRTAPFAFSQLAHWNLYELTNRPSRCVLPTALHVLGPLDTGSLYACLQEIVRRHDALRTRITLRDGAPAQLISPSSTVPFSVHDYREFRNDSVELVARRFIGSKPPISVLHDPLFSVDLLRISTQSHILIPMMEHIISDGYSLNVLVNELVTAYRQTVRGEQPLLPEVPMQFSSYATNQRASTKEWLAEHGKHYREHFAGCERTRFPDLNPCSRGPAGWAIAPVEIKAGLKRDLLNYSKSQHSTLVMCVLTAYIALVLRWCNTNETVVLFQSDGRSFQRIEESIGYYAFPLYLRVRLDPRDTFAELLVKVTREYCKAYEHADFSYLEAQTPRPDFTRNTCFNWLPAHDSCDTLPPENPMRGAAFAPISTVSERLAGYERDTEPMLGLIDSRDGVSGGVYYPTDRIGSATVAQFVQSLMTMIRASVIQPHSAVCEIALP